MIILAKIGFTNDLLERIKGDPLFSEIHAQLDSIMDPKRFCGRAEVQVREYISGIVEPLLEAAEEKTGRPAGDENGEEDVRV